MRRAGYPVYIEGVSMGKLTDEEKGLLSMVQCSERKNLDHVAACGVMFKIFSLLPYAAAVVLAVVVFAWGQT